MVPVSRTGSLAELLAGLKLRSGLSYEALARRTHLSRSTLHRYCTGLGVPVSVAAAESIGHACGATVEELAELGDRWWRVDRRRRRRGSRAA